MDDDQQFCLRWNNHQSTLVSVFDNLLENGTLVDCTLFAEGKFLKAHKVVLSACSPYFESLLTQEYDKHPIFILKDVKFQELKAMMDYMYRGEVNISQDQLAALLKAAESLQIKGLSDSRSKENDTRKAAPPPPAKTPPPAPTLPRVQGLTIEQRKTPKLSANTDVIEESRSRDGSISPVPRKRKKPKRRVSQDGVIDNHDASSSSESHSNPAAAVSASAQNIPSSTLPAVPLASTSKLTDVPDQLETKSDIITRQCKQQQQSSTSSSTSLLPQSSVSDSIPQVPIKEKLETHSELILEPKSEYIEEEMNEDSVEDLTLEDDDDVSQMEQEMDHARPGPSHGSTDGSQGFGGWHMSGNQAQDEVFLAAQEAVGAHRDSQVFIKEEHHDEQPELIVNYSKIIENINPDDPSTSGENTEVKVRYICNQCGANYSWKSNLVKHIEKKHRKHHEPAIKVESGAIQKQEIPIITSTDTHEVKENKNMHMCTKCGAYYSLKNNLLRHVKYHCGIPKQLACLHCEKEFRRSDNLKKHMLICRSVMEKMIATKEKDSSLFYTKIFKGEKKYFCKKCESEYTSRRGVLRHSQLECEVSRKHVCSYCSQNFNRRYLYIAHMKKMHGL